MYKRVEQIEEENLDWDQQNSRLIEAERMQKENVIFSPTYKSKKTLGQSLTEFDIEKRVSHFVVKNMEISSFMGILILPYFVGFLFTYVLFYSYGGMSIIAFLSIDKEFLLLQLWSIGAYMFVTLWLFWAFSHIVQSSKQLLPLYSR
jgi:hypothetical protein